MPRRLDRPRHYTRQVIITREEPLNSSTKNELASNFVKEKSLRTPGYPVGTKLSLRMLSPETLRHYWMKIVREVIEPHRANFNRLQQQGNLPEKTDKKLMNFQKELIRAKLDMMQYADSIEIAGHQLHVQGSIANGIYTDDNQFNANISFHCFLLFRRTVEGKALVYVHPTPVVSEYLALD